MTIKKIAYLISLATAVFSTLAAYPANADCVQDKTCRWQASQHGDFVWIGNTSAQDCAKGRVPAPQNRSTDLLRLPQGAVVTYARLYWGAEVSLADSDEAGKMVATVATGMSGISKDASTVVRKFAPSFPGRYSYWYVSSADVTRFVKSSDPNGGSLVTWIESIDLAKLNSEATFVAWSLVVFYSLDSDPLRNLTLFDDVHMIEKGSPKEFTVTGFQVPEDSGFDAKLGVMAFEGNSLTGGALWFEGHMLSNNENSEGNFFNSTHSCLGAPVSVVGDLPQMDGTPCSVHGLDLDIVDVKQYLAVGQTSATIKATSEGDAYVLGALVISIGTLATGGAGGTAGAAGSVGAGGTTDAAGAAGSVGSGGTTGAAGGAAGSVGAGGATDTAGSTGGAGSAGAGGRFGPQGLGGSGASSDDGGVAVADGAIDTGIDGSATRTDVSSSGIDGGRRDVLAIDSSPSGILDGDALDGGTAIDGQPPVRVDGGAVDLVAAVDSSDGTQLPPAGELDGGAPIKTGTIQGGGCSCALATQAQPSGGGLIALALVLGAGLRRRKRSR